jgi:hypothetical protein
LVLRGRSDLARQRQIAQEPPHLLRSHLSWMPLAMKEDEPLDQ